MHDHIEFLSFIGPRNLPRELRHACELSADQVGQDVLGRSLSRRMDDDLATEQPTEAGRQCAVPCRTPRLLGTGYPVAVGGREERLKNLEGLGTGLLLRPEGSP